MNRFAAEALFLIAKGLASFQRELFSTFRPTGQVIMCRKSRYLGKRFTKRSLRPSVIFRKQANVSEQTGELLANFTVEQAAPEPVVATEQLAFFERAR